MNTADRIIKELERQQRGREIRGELNELTVSIMLRNGASYDSRGIVRHDTGSGYLEITGSNPNDPRPTFIVTEEIATVTPLWH